jgi:hypothetical protein
MLSTFKRSVAVIVLAGTVLSGCTGRPGGSSALPIGPSAITAEWPNARTIALSNALGMVPARHPNHARSWMRPDAGKQWLLYVSDGSSGTIDVYNYRVKSGKLYGQITGLSFPYGQCVDRHGNVYVVDNATAKIYEYAHGGTTPIATADDAYGYPIGCAVDHASGNVAVANFDSLASGAGGVDVFTGGLGGSQTNYTDANLYHLWPPGYDRSGNLFVQATDYSGYTKFAELPAGASNFILLTGLTIAFPGAVSWDGSYITVTDQDYQYAYTTMIYRVTVSGSNATIVRSTHLTDDCYPGANFMVAVQPFIGGTTRKRNAVAAGNLNCPSRQDFFNYTNGGDPKRTLPEAIAPNDPYGQSISPPKAS